MTLFRLSFLPQKVPLIWFLVQPFDLFGMHHVLPLLLEQASDHVFVESREHLLARC